MSENYKIVRLELDYDVAAVQARFLKLYTGLVYDACEHFKIPGRAMDAGIYPLVPSMQVAGPAFTVHCVATPSLDEDLHNVRLGMLKSMTSGCIQIRDTQNCRSCGQFGEISATAAKAAGCAGAVIDGSTRDSNFLINMGFPTFCRFRSPVEAFGRFMAVEYQIPIFVNGIDGQLPVYPGDYVFGDNDGVVIVPREHTLRVLELAEEWCQTEGKSRQAMAAGKDPFEVYAELGRF